MNRNLGLNIGVFNNRDILLGEVPLYHEHNEMKGGANDSPIYHITKGRFDNLPQNGNNASP
jgi:hypothetical protein